MSALEDRGECAWRDSTASPASGTEREDDTQTLGRSDRELVDQALKSRSVYEFVGSSATGKQAEDAPADVFHE